MLRLAHGTVDLDTGEALLAGSATRISPHECALLRFLAERPRQAVTRDELLVQVLGYEPTASSRAADTAMARLRRKIEPDPSRPIHLLSVFGTGYRFEPAPEVELVTERVGLPVERTPFVGREDQLAGVLDALDHHPLVTLTGPAGVGKTRLALAVARAARTERVVFVSLRAATTGAEALGRLGLALGLPSEDTLVAGRAVEAVARRLASARTLLLLDNAEQLDDGFREVLEGLALPGGRSRLLVTSRRPTGGALEHLVRIGSLSPADALRLWGERAEAAGAQVDPEDPDLPILLAELDYLPLAVELAAARARALRPGAILRRLHERMRLLSGGPRDGDARDHSLSAALDWSWDLLTPEQREVLARCAVFLTPFSDEAAAAVAGPGAPDALLDLDRVSLCSRGPRGTELLRSVQVWAEDKASAAGVREDAEVRHGRYVVASVPRVPRTFEEIARVGAALPDLLAIPGRLERTDPATAVAAALAPHEWYQVHGPFDPWLAALDVGERAASASGDERLYRVIRARALVVRLRGESRRALAELDRALLVAPADARGILLGDRGIVLADLGRFPESEEAMVQALGLLPEGPDRVYAESIYAAQHMMKDAFDDDLEERFRRCVDAADRGLVAERLAAGIRANFGAWLTHTGRMEEAEGVLTAAIETLRAVGAERRLAGVLMNRGGARYRRGLLAEGAADAEEAVEILRREGYLRMLAWGLANLASLRTADGDEEDALLLLDEADEVALRTADHNAQHAIAAYRAVALARRGRIGEAEESVVRARAALEATGSRGDGLVRAAAAHVDAARIDDPAASERVAAILAEPPPGSGATFLLDLLRTSSG